MSSHSRCLYIGVTSDLHGRVWEHKSGVHEGFSKKRNKEVRPQKTPSS
jgi:predicted GIY-YIG superfamily endonuclease